MATSVESINQSHYKIVAPEQQRAEPVRTVAASNKAVQLSAPMPAAKHFPANVNNDVVAISENASIDLNMFNYIDKGGNTSKAMTGNESERKAFTPKPNFIGMSVSRYGQMKAEIEQNFAEDPETKNKYLQELDKALDDYIMLQAKIANQLAKGNKTNETAEDDGEEKTQYESADVSELKRLYQVGSKGVKAIINKVLGDSENNIPREINQSIDDLFIGAYRQMTNTTGKVSGYGEVSRDPKVKQIWESIRINIDSEV